MRKSSVGNSLCFGNETEAEAACGTLFGGGGSFLSGPAGGAAFGPLVAEAHGVFGALSGAAVIIRGGGPVGKSSFVADGSVLVGPLMPSTVTNFVSSEVWFSLLDIYTCILTLLIVGHL